MQNPIYRRQSKISQLFSGILFGAIAFVPAALAFIYQSGGI